jgi:hypothetical protein
LGCKWRYDIEIWTLCRLSSLSKAMSPPLAHLLQKGAGVMGR